MLKIFRLRVVNQFISWVVLISFLNLIHGCFYYKVTRSEAPPKQALVKL